MPSRDLVFRFIGRDVSAGKTFSGVGKEADHSSGKLTKLGVVADHLGVNVFGGMQHHVGATRESLDKLGIAGAGAGSMLKLGLAGGALAGGAALAEVAQKGAHEFIALAGQVRAFQRTAGTSAEEASRFVAALKLLGISSQTGATALSKLARVDPAKLHTFGVEIAHNADGTENLTGTLLNVVDAYGRTADSADRAKLVFAAFGRQGQALLPFLAKGRESIQELFKDADKHHQILSSADLENAREYTAATRQMHEAVSGLEMEIGKGLVPIMTGYADSITSAIDATDNFVHKHHWLSDLNNFSKWILTGSSSNKKNADAANDAASAQDTLKKATLAETDAAKKQAETLTKTFDATTENFKAQVDYQGAVDDVQSAVDDYNSTLNDNAQRQRDAADAASAVQSSALGVRQANADLTKAQKDYNDALHGSVEARQQLAGLESDLADKHLNVQQAQYELNKAQSEYNETLRDTSKSSDDMAQKDFALQQAKINLTRAQNEEKDAQKKLNDTRYEATHPAKDLADKELALEQAQLAAKDAARQHSDALAHQSEVAHTGSKRAADLADKQRALTTAVLAAGDAAVTAAEDQAKANGRTLTAKERTDAYVSALRRLERKFPQLKDQIDGYIKKVREIPGVKTTKIKADTRLALQGLADLQRQASKPIEVPLTIVQGPSAFVPGPSDNPLVGLLTPPTASHRSQTFAPAAGSHLTVVQVDARGAVASNDRDFERLGQRVADSVVRQSRNGRASGHRW